MIHYRYDFRLRLIPFGLILDNGIQTKGLNVPVALEKAAVNLVPYLFRLTLQVGGIQITDLIKGDIVHHHHRDQRNQTRKRKLKRQ